MAKQGEINYLRNLGEAGARHAAGKPFSDADCHIYLIEFGALLSLLPAPPARILDVGCGAGWTSLFLARRGYAVVGVDIAADMIAHAERLRDREGLADLRFRVGDYEEMCFDDVFDGALFYESLHHAVDEAAALRMVYRALRPGGVCVLSEPGRGHAASPTAVTAVQKYGVTERDMPPAAILAAARAAGFRESRVYPHAWAAARMIYGTSRLFGRWTQQWGWLRKLESVVRFARLRLLQADHNGIVVLVK
jgi:SAM-dependent methyltransferase